MRWLHGRAGGLERAEELAAPSPDECFLAGLDGVAAERCRRGDPFWFPHTMQGLERLGRERLELGKGPRDP